MEEAINCEVPIATNRSILAEGETAFQNAYKAIESVVGDPPKDDIKFEKRLSKIGLLAAEKIGYKRKRTLLESIREFEIIRNKRVAHGSTPSRGLTVLEVLECQACAKHIIEAALDCLAGPTSMSKCGRWYVQDRSSWETG
jgi:hypothetical protein